MFRHFGNISPQSGCLAMLFYWRGINPQSTDMPTIKLQKRKPPEVTVNKTAYQGIYNTRRWKKLRELKFRNNPVCEECEKIGITRQTEEVHHRIPFDIGDLNIELAYDYDNLIALCAECHHRIHEKLRTVKLYSPYPSNIEYR